MKLIVGLGNYPEKYEKTRHNFGFLGVDRLQKLHNFTEWRYEKKFFGWISIGTLKDEKVILLKPKTLMNLSGQAVLALTQFYKLEMKDIRVFSDDLDLSFGAVKFREKGSDGGQRGLRDIFARLGSREIARVKLGISNEFRSNIPADKFVLMPFNKEEWESIEPIIDQGIRKMLDSL